MTSRAQLEHAEYMRARKALKHAVAALKLDINLDTLLEHKLPSGAIVTFEENMMKIIVPIEEEGQGVSAPWRAHCAGASTIKDSYVKYRAGKIISP